MIISQCFAKLQGIMARNELNSKKYSNISIKTT